MNLPQTLMVLLAALSLAACQRTVFENPPALAQCDAELGGHWLSVDADGELGEMRAEIGNDCQLRTIEQRIDGVRTSQATALGTGMVRQQRVLWVEAQWAHRSYEIDPGPLDQAGDVYLYGYDVTSGDRLTLYPVSSRLLAERAVDRKMKADLLLLDGSLTVRPRGDVSQQREQLPSSGLFDRSEPLQFVRAPANSADGSEQ